MTYITVVGASRLRVNECFLPSNTFAPLREHYPFFAIKTYSDTRHSLDLDE